MKKFSENIFQRLTARHQKCFQFCDNLKNKDILDIGCSRGWFEKMALESECKSVTGIEPDQKYFYSAQKEVPGAKFQKGDALNLPFKDKLFDTVVIFDVLEHLPKNTELLAFREIRRVLQPRGKVIISTPYSFWLSKIMDPAWYFGHRHYKEVQLTKMLKKCGFKIKNMEKRGRVFEMISTILIYIFKWVFRREIPFKNWFEMKRNSEYLTNKEGFQTLYVKAIRL